MKVDDFMNEAIALARRNVSEGGRPFGAVVVKHDKIIAKAMNRMHINNDPTAHAELLALREAGQKLGTMRLVDCTVYASGQPCPMCLAAMRLSGISRVFFAYANADGEPYGLSTAGIAEELSLSPERQTWAKIEHMPPEDSNTPALYETWIALQKSQA